MKNSTLNSFILMFTSVICSFAAKNQKQFFLSDWKGQQENQNNLDKPH